MGVKIDDTIVESWCNHCTNFRRQGLVSIGPLKRIRHLCYDELSSLPTHQRPNSI